MSAGADMHWDAVIVGGGPAGLSAALNLVRARRRVLVLDSNRPRNSATFHAHGYLSRDGISPLELRRLGREELDSYPDAAFEKTQVTRIERVPPFPEVPEGNPSPFPEVHSTVPEAPEGITPTVPEVPEGPQPRFTIDAAHTATTVVIATGLREELPALPTLRAFYGTSIHSCMECDGYEYADKPIALLGDSDDLAERALLLSQWSRDLIVFTNGVAAVTDEQEQDLAQRGIRVDRRVVADVAGDRDGLTGIVLADGETVPRVGLFVRPRYTPMLDYISTLGVERDADDLIVVDADGRTNIEGVYAIGDCTPPGPQQLIVAAGQGARVASTINRDLLR